MFHQTKFWDQCTLKKADPEMFSYWGNDIFAEKQALFDRQWLQNHQWIFKIETLFNYLL